MVISASFSRAGSHWKDHVVLLVGASVDALRPFVRELLVLPAVPPDDWAELVRDLDEQFAGRSHHRGTEMTRRRRDGTPA